MSRLIKALKVFGVSLVAAIIVTGTGGYFLLDHIYTIRIIDIKQYALSRNFTRSEIAKGDAVIESKMLEHEGAFYALFEQSHNIGSNLDLITSTLTDNIQSVSRDNAESIDQFHQQLESSSNVISLNQAEIVSILQVIEELNNELEDIKENQLKLAEEIIEELVNVNLN